MIGTTLGFLVWFTGFLVIGGEWFAMWQSATWNGQEAAFRFYGPEQPLLEKSWALPDIEQVNLRTGPGATQP